MADNTKIEWTDSTWNVITGCSVVSAGCRHCYAMKLAGTRLQHHPSRAGLTIDTKEGPVWSGEVRFNEQWLTQPLAWRRPRKVFVCAHGDLFHENVPDEWIDRVFAVMALAPHHTFQVLTKRAGRMREYLSDPMRLEKIYLQWHTVSGSPREAQDWPLSNVWIGVSVEDQVTANQRIPPLLLTPAAVRWISAEPLLGPVIIFNGDPHPVQMPRNIQHPPGGIGWVVAGGESGHNARPMHIEWCESLRDQCKAAGVAFFMKQMTNDRGRKIPREDWPQDLNIEEYPEARP